ncbi:transcriptional regulator, ArgR family [Lachnospiraceae bacterium YSD2013]|nr:arginine repressor [Lachnospiraceae bacterium]MBO4824120.1 arginine repressor [Lachnospiraceae bacterium]MBR5762778.1 arginine repressor [Lachnospiraceae bacterium]SCX07608.1 transcriptional regulator, ArgR family [Lachnospiraceae bacterium YSD2013]
MKNNRHKKILELIEKYDIDTQDELCKRLEEAGFSVTQATVSRDINNLHLYKKNLGNGRQKYAIDVDNDHELDEKYRRVLTDGFVSIDMAQNILVIKTVSGMAMAVAAAIDSLKFTEIVGTIAGDDTIMMAIRTVEDTKAVMSKIQSIIGD